MKLLNVSLIAVAWTLAGPDAGAASISGGKLIEDFSTLEHFSFTDSTGIWNVVNQRVQMAAFANGEAARPISFGDGSDGIVDSATGFSFNTDHHPDGYNFISLRITSGPITVTGSRALVIRSLGAVTVVPSFSVSSAQQKGGDAVLGTGSSPAVGLPVSCLSSGGSGGTSSATTAANGGDGLQSSGIPETGNAGVGHLNPPPYVDIDAAASFTGPTSNNFDVAANFICGTGGSGGGAHSNGGVNFASGGSGGAGGGRVRISAIGPVTVGTIFVRGGDGGKGATIPASGCSGNGSGGSGGAAWLQSLNALTAPVPDVSGGTSGVSTCSAGSGAGLSGFARGDSAPASRPGWAAGDFNTDQVPANFQSVVNSRTYDLGVWNAGFKQNATVIQSLNGGQIQLQYAGSADDFHYSDFTADLTSLSDHNYRYLRFRITLNSGGSVAISPNVKQISIGFEELGLRSVDLALSPGCASLQNVGPQDPAQREERDRVGLLSTLFWIVMTSVAYGAVRMTRAGVA